MPDFRCRVATPTGEIVLRDYSARDASSLRHDLERQDLLVLSVQRRSAVLAGLAGFGRRKRKVRIKEFLHFNQEFAALVRAGLPITECLQLLTERRKNPTFRAALEDVRDRVRGGESLSEAFAAQEIFPPLYSSTLASGERSGEVATVLQRYVSFATTMMNVRKRVVSALTYPAILFTLAIGIVLILLLYVLPKFEGLFADFGGDLPVVTEVVLGISNTIRDHYLLVGGALAGLLIAVAAWRRTPAGQRMLERVMYKVPLMGRIAQSFVVTRFSRTLGTLVAGGIPVVTSLEVLGRSIGTPVFADAVRQVEDKIREGAALWSSLEETGLFPDMLVEMVKVGESSGSLAEMLTHVADFTDQEIDHELQTLVSLVEPALLVAMALIVATIVLAIFLPLIKLYAATSSL